MTFRAAVGKLKLSMSVTPTTAINSPKPLNVPHSAPAAAADEPLETPFPVRRFSVAEYERIGNTGILTEDDSVELLEGLIVEKMTKNPRHDATIDVLANVTRVAVHYRLVGANERSQPG